MNNLVATRNSTSTIALGSANFKLSALKDRLDALILILKTCKGKTCRDPWSELLPNTEISTLLEAMDTKFDEHFAAMPKIGFSRCEDGYIAESEGPMWNSVYGQAYNARSMERSLWNRP